MSEAAGLGFKKLIPLPRMMLAPKGAIVCKVEICPCEGEPGSSADVCPRKSPSSSTRGWQSDLSMPRFLGEIKPSSLYFSGQGNGLEIGARLQERTESLG